jgi:hypothetical protein
MSRIITTAVLCLMAMGAQAQKFKLEEGAFKSIRKEKEIRLEFRYDSLMVKKKLSEKQYIDEKRAAYNEKEAGRGDRWAKEWFEDRQKRFEPEFEKMFNNNEMFHASVKHDTARFTLIIHTVGTDPGYYQQVVRQPAFVDVYVTLIDKRKPGKSIAKLHVWDVTGVSFGGADFDTGIRLTEAYAKLGKELGEWIVKKGLN